MDRRELLGVLGVGAAGLIGLGLGVGAARADLDKQEHDGHITIGECAGACDEAAYHCLAEFEKGGPRVEQHATTYKAVKDCRAFCTLTARSSPMAKYAYAGCADACRDCAAACEDFQAPIMDECVKACRDCEEVCRRLAGCTR